MNDRERIVVAIPHYFGPPVDGLRRHGSLQDGRAHRAGILRNTVLGLHQAFGLAQCMMQLDRGAADAANQSLRRSLRVLICTTSSNHVLDEANLPSGSFEQVFCNDVAPELGYACHAVLKSHVEAADWFGYMEDDLLILDPMWFVKLSWFIALAGADAVLLPNRFERGDSLMANKAYVDGDLADRVTQEFQDRSHIPEIRGESCGQVWRFVRPKNPHSGCFFLRADQMKHWIGQACFGDRSRSFIGPLESAATLGLMRCLRIYKPAAEQAGFFEVEHQSRQFIGQLRRRSASRGEV